MPKRRKINHAETLFPTGRGYRREFSHKHPDPEGVAPARTRPVLGTNVFRVAKKPKVEEYAIGSRYALEPMSRDEALCLAAWLYVLADGDDDDTFSLHLQLAKEG